VSEWRPPLWYARLGGIAWRAVVIVAAVALLIAGLDADTVAAVDDSVSDHVASTLRVLGTGIVRVAPTVASAVTTLLLSVVVAFIPFIGAFLSGLLAVLLALGDRGLGVGVAMLIVVLVVQVREGNVLQPWIQARAVKLHPLVIALAVAAGGAIAGFLGIFLAVPVTAAGVVALSELRRAGILGPPEGDVTPGVTSGGALPVREEPVR